MKVEVFSICDAATDQGGRLNVLGIFESVSGPIPPIFRERCSIVVRLRFAADEVGQHQVALRFFNKQGQRIMPEMKAKFAVKIPANRTSTAVNLVMNINRLKFDNYGDYEAAFFHGGVKVSSIPIFVKCSSRGQPKNRMNN